MIVIIDFGSQTCHLIGRRLRDHGIPIREIIHKQVFPGPGQAIRIIGEVTRERLKKQQKADNIVLEEIKEARLYNKVYMSFSVLTNTKSIAKPPATMEWE